MTKQPFVSTTDPSLRTFSSTYDKDASTYTLLFDFVAIGLQTIQFLLCFAKGAFPPSHFCNKLDDKLALKVALVSL
jgi:hypothetical protein